MTLTEFYEKLIQQGAKTAFAEEMIRGFKSAAEAENLIKASLKTYDNFPDALSGCFDFENSILGADYWSAVQYELINKSSL